MLFSPRHIRKRMYIYIYITNLKYISPKEHNAYIDFKNYLKKNLELISNFEIISYGIIVNDLDIFTLKYSEISLSKNK